MNIRKIYWFYSQLFSKISLRRSIVRVLKRHRARFETSVVCWLPVVHKCVAEALHKNGKIIILFFFNYKKLYSITVILKLKILKKMNK